VILKKDAAGLYEILAHPPVHCFLSEKLDSLDEAEKEVEQRGKEGKQFAVCLSDTELNQSRIGLTSLIFYQCSGLLVEVQN